MSESPPRRLIPWVERFGNIGQDTDLRLCGAEVRNCAGWTRNCSARRAYEQRRGKLTIAMRDRGCDYVDAGNQVRRPVAIT